MEHSVRFCLIGPVWPYRGGISHISTILAEALIKQGHNVLVVSFRRQYPQWLYPGQSDKDNSQNPLKTPAKYILDPFLPWTWKKGIDIVLAYKPELVIVQWWTFFWSIPFAYISRYLHNHEVRVAYMVHNVSSHEKHILDRFLTRLALSTTQDFMVFSEIENQNIQRLMPGKRVIVSHLPIYSFSSSDQVSKAAARVTLNLPDQETILLFFGIVRPYKGLNVLLKAMGRLKDKGITPYLAIVGEFWKDKQHYLDLIEQTGIQAQVRIEDRYVPNEEADLWFRAADVLIAPYIQGVTQSAVASLALGYRLPIIVTIQVAQGIEKPDQNNVYIVPPDNIEALEKEISNFTNNYTRIENTPKIDTIDANQLTRSLLELINTSESTSTPF
jgi:glycosyltransferase involved in cell wall biosynthesis